MQEQDKKLGEIYKSKRGNDMLVVDHHIYHHDSSLNVRNRWRCKIRTCRGKLWTKDNCIIKSTPHDHDPLYDNVDILAMKECLAIGCNTNVPPMKLVLDVLKSHKLDHIDMPKLKSLRDSITRRRKRLSQVVDKENNGNNCSYTNAVCRVCTKNKHSCTFKTDTIK